MDSSLTHHPRSVAVFGLDDVRVLVRLERKRQKLSQQRIADLCGTSQKWVSEVETGNTVPDADRLLRLLACLGICIILTPRAEVPVPSDGDPWTEEDRDA